MLQPLLALALAAALQGAPPKPAPPHQDPGAGAAFDARAAEHLFNRAGFGATGAQIQAAVARGREATLELLFPAAAPKPLLSSLENHAFGGVLSQDSPLARGERPRPAAEDPGEDSMAGSGEPDAAQVEREEAMRREQAAARVADGRQLAEHTNLWLGRMVQGEAALVERMALFWHGHFTSSMQTVRSSHALIQQHELLRRHALGSFRDLLAGVLRDPAMLVYLDNHRNRRGNPNENLARELLELFTLGEGHYTEEDVKEAARALTGRAVLRGEYVFTPRRHDGGTKRILGQEGNFDGDDLVEILLAHPRTSVHIAGRLLNWFEGVEPSAERVERYAARLRDADWQMAPVVRALFLDPHFYGPDVVGARVASPVDFLVGSVRRLGIDAPVLALNVGARVLGERLFFPPSVKGWDGGEAWITTSSLLGRGNLAGMLTGSIGVMELLGADLESMEGGDDGGMQRRGRRPPRARDEELRGLVGRDQGLRDLGRLGRGRWLPKLDLVGRLQQHWAARMEDTPDGETLGAATLPATTLPAKAPSDGDVVHFLLEELLAIAPPTETRAELVQYLAAQRAEFSIPAGRWLNGGQDGEQLLTQLAHRILALPEAQLH